MIVCLCLVKICPDMLGIFGVFFQVLGNFLIHGEGVLFMLLLLREGG